MTVTQVLKRSREANEAQEIKRPLPAWLPFIPLFTTFVLLSFRSAGPIDDPDTWWHLRLGEEFRGTWSPGEPGQLSEFATEPWVSTQWLLEVLASCVHDYFELAGVAWLAGLAVLVLGVVLYAACRDGSGPIVATLATVLGLSGAGLSLSPRPQVASFILTALFVHVWLKTTRDKKPRWWLIPLSWVWVNTHGMWFLGPLVGGVVVLGMMLDRSVTHRRALTLAAVPVFGVLVAALTPVGAQLLVAPLATESMAQFVTEWKPPDFTATPAAMATAGMLLVTVFAWARSPRSISWPRLLLLAVAALWTVYAYRTVAVGAVIAAPLFATALASWSSTRHDSPSTTGERRLLFTVLVTAVVALTVAVPSLSEPKGDEVPSRLNGDLTSLPEGTVLFNSYELGGWLEWQHRNVVPVIDPMLDAYPVSYVSAYQDASWVRPGWRQFVAGTGADHALLEVDSSLALALRQRLGWAATSVDPEAGYVLLEAPAN